MYNNETYKTPKIQEERSSISFNQQLKRGGSSERRVDNDLMSKDKAVSLNVNY